MLEIMALFSCLNPVLNYTSIRQLACITEAMLAMSGRVTMWGLSRWTSEGGSYRTIQRFFSTQFNWPAIRWSFARRHLLEDENDTVVIIGDEVLRSQVRQKNIWYWAFFLLTIWKSCA